MLIKSLFLMRAARFTGRYLKQQIIVAAPALCAAEVVRVKHALSRAVAVKKLKTVARRDRKMVDKRLLQIDGDLSVPLPEARSEMAMWVTGINVSSFGIGLAKHIECRNRRWPSGVKRQVGKKLGDFALRYAVFAGKFQVPGKLFRAIHRDQRAESDEASVAR
jgi:hypothetical protein